MQHGVYQPPVFIQLRDSIICVDMIATLVKDAVANSIEVRYKPACILREKSDDAGTEKHVTGMVVLYHSKADLLLSDFDRASRLMTGIAEHEPKLPEPNV